MQWQYQYSITSFIITAILLIFYSSKKYLPVRSNYYFKLILWLQLTSCSLDMLSSLVLDNYDSLGRVLSLVITALYFASYFAVILALFLYVKSLCTYTSVRQKPVTFLVYVPMAAALVIFLASPAAGWAYDITAGAGYIHGPLFFVYYAVTDFYCFVCLLMALMYRKKLSLSQRITIYAGAVILGAGVYLKTVYSEYMLMNLLVMLVLLLLYLSHQNPSNSIDDQTGLFNERAFIISVNECISIRRPISFICFDIYNYEMLRAAYGGDEIEVVKRNIARYLRKNYQDALPFYLMRGKYVLMFRDGNDHLKDAEKISARFEESWKAYNTKDSSIQVRAVLSYIPDSIEFEDATQARDTIYRAVHFADQDGDQNVHMVDDDVIERIQRDVDVEMEIDRAIRENSIEVYYQPIYSTAEKRIVSAEALARLHSDKYGFIPPDEFITIAERTGDIMRLGEQIFEKVCRFMKEHDIHSMGLDYIEVNLSPIQCRDVKLARQLYDMARQYKVPMTDINLEITETATENIDLISEQINRLKDCGSTFSMDDYGTGYSNLMNIFSLPFKIIKIDKSIVWSYFKEKNNDMLADIIPMFKKRGYHIVTEGVDSREMVEKLTEWSCDYLQGWYFSKALPPEEFLKYVEDFNSRKTA